MNLMKKIISSVLSVVMLVSLVPAASFAADTVHNVIYSDDFESYAENSVPSDITVSGDEGSVYVATVGSSKRLYLENGSDIKTVGVKKTFSKLSGKIVTFELDFLQLYNTSTGDTVLGIYSGDTPVLSIETNNGNISYKESAGYTPIVENYGYNRTYSIKAEVNLVDKTADVYIDTDKIRSFDLLDKSGTVDSIVIEAKYSPGFTVDNLNIYMDEDINNIEIEGNTTPVIPAYDVAEYEYTAKVTDANGADVSNTVLDWTLVNAPEGVSLENTTGEKVKLSVSKDATPASFSLKTQVRGSDVTSSIGLTLENVSAQSLEIIGWTDYVDLRHKDGTEYKTSYPSYRITAEDGNPKTYKFTAKVLDQFGNEAEKFGTFTWSLFVPDGEPELPDYVSINPANGVVTVTKNPTAEQWIGIRAVSNDDTTVMGETKLSLLDYDTYSMDKVRFDALVAHTETVMEAASIEGSPLLADIFVRSTKTPAFIPFSEGDLAASNVMSQSNLMQLMYNLTEVTGNSKYRDRVNEIYRYMMTNGLHENGIQLMWGGHMFMDLHTNSVLGRTTTHEIKGTSPFVAPLVAPEVNVEYEDDKYNNGNGFGGFLVRAMFSGHALGDYEQLAFERHWMNGENATAFEPVWQTPEVFDSERRGPVQRDGGAAFASCGSNLISILIEFYEQTGDENALKWAENLVTTVQNSEFTYYVYKDPQGNYIWPSDTTGDANKDGGVDEGDFLREYYDKNNELVYKSVKPDTVVMYGKNVANAIYEHRDVAEVDTETGETTDIVKVTDNNGNEVELTLYNQWSEGFFQEMATTKGGEHKAVGLSENLGYQWYLSPSYSNYTGPEWGDRLYNNLILGSDDPTDMDSWIEMGLCSPEEGELMLTPYDQNREPCIIQWGTAYCGVINAYLEKGDIQKATELMDRYSKSVYNQLKLRWDFDQNKFEGYMCWIRPEYMRENEIVDYVEIGVDETHDKDRYFKVNKDMGAPHRGYYYQPGVMQQGLSMNTVNAKDTASICITLRDTILALEATDPSDPAYAANMEKAQLFRTRLSYVWNVFRDMMKDRVCIGDVGEDVFNLEPKLDVADLDGGLEMMELAVIMYEATGHKEFLKLARSVANKLLRSTYVPDEKIFISDSEYFAGVALDSLPIYLKIDAYLLDRYDENIKYDFVVQPTATADTETFREDGMYTQNFYFSTQGALYEDREVKAKSIEINHDVIELKVGESMVIDYEVLPFDAEKKGVTWDIYDTGVALMNSSTATIYGRKRGKTRLRCVSTAYRGLASKEVEVIVK